MGIHEAHIDFILKKFGKRAVDFGKLFRVQDDDEVLSTIYPGDYICDAVTTRVSKGVYKHQVLNQDGTEFNPKKP